MLKIKDNVDLKELENFGFVGESFQNGFKFRNCYVFRNDLQQNIISINLDWTELYRTIELGIPFTHTDEGIEKLFDLIQAGLVEKVEEEKNVANTR